MTYVRRYTRRLRERDREGGQVALEFVAFVPILAIVGILCLQAYVTVTAYERVHDAARDTARLISKGGLDQTTPRAKAEEILPGWLVEKPDLPTCDENDNPDSGNCLPDRICQAGEDPAQDRCLPSHTCVDDGEEKPWEETCVSVGPGAKVTVKTEIPLLLKGGPLVFPIEATVTMPSGGVDIQTASAPIGGGGVSNQANRALGKKMAAERGWTGEEWNCLDELWQHESGWSHTAANSISSAYGIPQAMTSLHQTGRYALPSNYRTSPKAQIQWGLYYIADKYGTPCDAWEHWKERDPHGY